jgi:23S rRNA (uracil1939-C5)-methyltransferase
MGMIVLLESHPRGSQVLPVCRHFEECGGCQFQNLSIADYQDWKEKSVREIIGKGPNPQVWHEAIFVPEKTRRRVTFSAIKQGGIVTTGFHRHRSHDIVSIAQCHLILPSLQSVLERMPIALASVLHEKVEVDVFLQDVDGNIDCVITGLPSTGARQTENLAKVAEELGLARMSLAPREGAEAEIYIDVRPVQKTSGKLSVFVPPAAFLQPSAEGESALVSAVSTGLSSLKGNKNKIVDLFSGCGTFAGPLLERGFVLAVEEDKKMVAALQKAARANGRLTVEHRDLFKEPVSPRELVGYNAVVLDPPRAGAREQVLKLVKSSVPIVVYVSCHPLSFARDAKILVEGGYLFESLQIVDQFIWSSHVELVGVFRRKS